MTWRSVDGPEPTKLHHEKFGAVARVSDELLVVTYVSANGYTLIVALDLAHGDMVGFASGHGLRVQQKGVFELLPEPA